MPKNIFKIIIFLNNLLSNYRMQVIACIHGCFFFLVVYKNQTESILLKTRFA